MFNEQKWSTECEQVPAVSSFLINDRKENLQ